MNPLSIEDIEQIVHLVSEAGDPTTDLPLPDRKRMLVEGVARLIDADVFIWSTAVADPNRPSDAMPTCIIDGGWRDGREQALVYEALTNKEFTSHTLHRVSQGVSSVRHITMRRTEFVPEDVWRIHGGPWLKAGLEHSVLTIYPFSPTTFSGVGFHRRVGRPNFTDRDKALVHVVFSQVRWLHLHGTNEPAGSKALHLTPRERQVLLRLIQGESKKQIAYGLGLSEHTVGDHVKQLYKHFNVNSRGELQALFLAGSGPS